MKNLYITTALQFVHSFVAIYQKCFGSADRKKRNWVRFCIDTKNLGGIGVSCTHGDSSHLLSGNTVWVYFGRSNDS